MVIDYKLNFSLEGIPEFVNNLVKKLEPMVIDKDKLFDVRLCLEEGLINALKHGNKMDKNKDILLKINASAKSLEIEIKDEGKGFDYSNILLPSDDKNIEKLNGRGIFLIKKFMDKVEFFDGGSKIKMVRYWEYRGK